MTLFNCAKEQPKRDRSKVMFVPSLVVLPNNVLWNAACSLTATCSSEIASRMFQYRTNVAATEQLTCSVPGVIAGRQLKLTACCVLNYAIGTITISTKYNIDGQTHLSNISAGG